MSTTTGPNWGVSYRPTLTEAMRDLARLVADGKCDAGTAAECAVAEIRYEGELRKVDPLDGLRGPNSFIAIHDALSAAEGHTRRALFLAAELIAEIGESLLDSAAPVGLDPRREEGDAGNHCGGDGETVPEEGGEVKGGDDE